MILLICYTYLISGLAHSWQQKPYGENTSRVAQQGGMGDLTEQPGRDGHRPRGAHGEVKGRAKVCLYPLLPPSHTSLCSIWAPSGLRTYTPHQTQRSQIGRHPPLRALMGGIKTHYSCSQRIPNLFQHCGQHSLSLSPPFPPL